MSSVVVPGVRYARDRDGVALAYQVVGQGPVDIVYVPPWVSNLEVIWENPLYARFLGRLAAFARLIVVDPRGMGLSDRFAPADVPPVEVLMEDLGVVMDSADAGRPVLFGSGNSGSLNALFAATHPDRTLALIVYGAEARGRHAPDYPWAWSDEEWDQYLAGIEHGWGTSEYVDEVIGWITPSLAADAAQRRWWGRLQRLSASPNSVTAVEKVWREIDVRPILSAIQAPTLVLHRTGDPIEDVAAGRDFAAGVPGAQFVELPGDDWPAWAGDQALVAGHVEAFVQGIQREAARLDRVLTTVLFTDIVGSTERATAIGDERWRVLLGAHHAKVRALVSRYRGTERDTNGDGFLATFDGPARAVLCARAIADAMDPIGLQIRAGVHTGECHIDGNQLTGIAVHIGARVAALAGAGEVLVSATVKDLVAGSGIEFTEHGRHALKGVDGEWALYAVAAT
jgi:class 3 adenylate cyclase